MKYNLLNTVIAFGLQSECYHEHNKGNILFQVVSDIICKQLLVHFFPQPNQMCIRLNVNNFESFNTLI